MNYRMCLTLSIILCGCGQIKEIGQPAAATLSGGIKESADQLRRGIESVGAGISTLKDIDPIALKTLLTQNQDLEKKLHDLQGQFTSFGPRAGLVNVTSTNRIYFEITGYQGALRLDAWIDNDKNWFIRNSVLQANPPKLAITFDASTSSVEDVAKKSWAEVTGKPMDGHLWTCEHADAQQVGQAAQRAAACRFAGNMSQTRQAIDKEYERRVNEAFAKFLTSPFALPTGTLQSPQAIDQRLTATSGEHSVFIRVTPITPDAGNKWAIEYKTYLTSTNGTQLLIATGRLDSETSTWSVGQPTTPAEAARFFVEIAKQHSIE